MKSNPDNLKFLKATDADVNNIQKLLKASDLPFEDIDTNTQHFWVYKSGTEINAVCGLEIYGNLALLRSLAVAPDSRTMGIAKALYNYVIITGSKEFGIKSFYILTTTAQNFFAKNGWKIIHRKAVPLEIQSSKEFSSLCPESAVCMVLFYAGTYAGKAVETFNKNFNCAQSVFLPFTHEPGLEPTLALKIASGFGGGICSKGGGLCGAVTGAYMAIGLKYGRSEAGDLDAKELTHKKMQAFDKAFLAKHKSLDCKDLLDGEMGNPEDLKLMKEAHLFEKACPVFVYTASSILEELFRD